MHVSLFKLAPKGNRGGISCDTDGAFIGSVPLLKRTRELGRDVWVPRDHRNVSKDLGACVGLPIDMSSKAAALAAIARALNAGDIARAQMLVLFLRFPDPTPILKARPHREDVLKFVGELIESDLVKANWDPTKHPRWPAKAPDSQGGRFAPKGSDTNDPGIGHNSRNALPEEEATLEDEFAIGGESILADVGALATTILLATTVPAGSAEEDKAIEKFNLHHSWPKYLGGAINQALTKLPRSCT